MNTKLLEKFAQAARRQLQEQVAAKLERVLRTDSAELRERADALKELKQQIDQHGRAVVIERVAYTWFNRFCALRYMDANHFTRIGTVSPAAGFTQPELLQEAKQGHIDDELTPFVKAQTVLDLLGGRLPSPDPQQEAYRLLLVAVCNYYHTIMPFLFERIADYTELMMPDDLLSAGSLLSAVREALTPENCQDVEVIGWLYQFYIAEKKDEVFAALKQNKKIASEDIPAATQLFTPHWIVRYLVENSLGRLWLLNRPTSRLVERMPYYIRPEQQETDFLRINSPEELKLCDPACGSGHMLVYAFDLLYAIYEEEGYNAPDIPRLILEKNLYGIEIDDRAGALTAFALTMKAREKDRRFFRRDVQPNICVLQTITFDDGELERDAWLMGSGMLRKTLLHDLHLFAQADYAGSLLCPQLRAAEIVTLRQRLAQSRPQVNDLFGGQRQEKVMAVLAQGEYLARKYHVVIANPPYMGGKGMNDNLKQFLQDNYANVKSDLFSAFIVRIMAMTHAGSFIGMMTPFIWMFLSTYEKLRTKILDETTIMTLVRPEYHAFFDSAYVPICSFILFTRASDFKGIFIDLNKFYGKDIQPIKALEAINNPNCSWLYRASTSDFNKMPGKLIAYWLSERLKNVFHTAELLGEIEFPRKGLTTGKNDKYIRLWHEIRTSKFSMFYEKKWFPMTKGGNFRKWYGNNEYVINWENSGKEMKTFSGSVVRNEQYYLREGGSWNDVAMASFSIRYTPSGYINNASGPMIYSTNVKNIILLLNSVVAKKIFEILSPTMKFEIGAVASFPVIREAKTDPKSTDQMIDIAKIDWDSYENSWDFSDLPLLRIDFRCDTFSDTYTALCNHWHKVTLEMQRLEEENNHIFIEAYGLQDELTPDVPLAEITLTCNPYYRYEAKKPAAELEKLLLADTMREFISYAVGCMLGRYALDKPGLILANQGETVEDYLRIIGDERAWHRPERSAYAPDPGDRCHARGAIPNPTFLPDKDNVIPMLDGDWFTDDISERFKRFLRVTFGEPHYAENLAFIEAALSRDLRNYFLREFYDDHVRRYQKRPIYWLFSSPKGSFNALIYMHRYQPHTVSVVLNDYLREFITKLSARKNHLQTISISAAATPRDKTAALKEIDKLDKVLAELTEYENEILYPLATRQVQIDLDDGVKVNYNKFGKALRKITGLSE